MNSVENYGDYGSGGINKSSPMLYTYLFNKEDNCYLISGCDCLGWSGRLLSAREPKHLERFLKTMERGGYEIARTECFPYQFVLDKCINKKQWKRHYYEYIPLKMGEDMKLTNELLFPTSSGWLYSVDSYNKEKVSLFQFDYDTSDFEYHKKALNDAKEYIRKMADKVWKDEVTRYQPVYIQENC